MNIEESLAKILGIADIVFLERKKITETSTTIERLEHDPQQKQEITWQRERLERIQRAVPNAPLPSLVETIALLSEIEGQETERVARGTTIPGKRYRDLAKVHGAVAKRIVNELRALIESDLTASTHHLRLEQLREFLKDKTIGIRQTWELNAGPGQYAFMNSLPDLTRDEVIRTIVLLRGWRRYKRQDGRWLALGEGSSSDGVRIVFDKRVMRKPRAFFLVRVKDRHAKDWIGDFVREKWDETKKDERFVVFKP